MSGPEILDLPASPPITELHAWIGIYAAGGEGLVSADLPMPSGHGMRHMPLISSLRENAEAMKPLAQRIQSSSQHTASRLIGMELRTFRMVSP